MFIIKSSCCVGISKFKNFERTVYKKVKKKLILFEHLRLALWNARVKLTPWVATQPIPSTTGFIMPQLKSI